MQIMITHSAMARTRVLRFERWQLLFAAVAMALVLMLTSGAVYHFLFLKASREGWPVVSQLVRWVVRDDLAQRERYMQQNLDAIARRVGEMQARMTSLQIMGERVSGLAGLQPGDLQPAPSLAEPASPAASSSDSGATAGQGGPFRGHSMSSAESISNALASLDESIAVNTDVFILIESRLMEARLASLMVPSSRPVDGPVGSSFGFRYDPFNGRQALHTGLDFPAPVGTPIQAAAGGVVLAIERHADYGNLLTLDHGNGLVTRYAHLSRVLVEPGDIVRRRQPIAEVGSTGRSTGPHLHFEVLLAGVPQNPARFLAKAPSGRVLN